MKTLMEQFKEGTLSISTEGFSKELELALLPFTPHTRGSLSYPCVSVSDTEDSNNKKYSGTPKGRMDYVSPMEFLSSLPKKYNTPMHRILAEEFDIHIGDKFDIKNSSWNPHILDNDWVSNCIGNVAYKQLSEALYKARIITKAKQPQEVELTMEDIADLV